MKMGGGWVLEADIQGFFEALDHQNRGSFLDQRVRDGGLRRAIHKWLKAGVLDDGRVVRSGIARSRSWFERVFTVLPISRGGLGSGPLQAFVWVESGEFR